MNQQDIEQVVKAVLLKMTASSQPDDAVHEMGVFASLDDAVAAAKVAQQGLKSVAMRQLAIHAFEAQLISQSIQPLKCFLQLSRDEQKRRLQERVEQPHKRWKLHSSDLQSYREFDLRQQRWAEQLAASHSDAAPWYVIPADHRWLRDWLVASLLARELEGLKLDWPDTPPPFSLEDLQRS